jgi:ribosomal protein S27AE
MTLDAHTLALLNNFCPECGSDHYKITDDPVNHIVSYDCPDCGYEGQDSYEDLYGSMSVPWGGY